MAITLGRKVIDKYSGFQGIAVGRAEYIFKESEVSVQLPADENGKLPGLEWLAEGRLEEVDGDPQIGFSSSDTP